MTHRVAVVGLTVAFGLAGLAGGAPGMPAAPLAADEPHDFVFLGPDRPVWLRLRVEIDGKPLRVHADGYLRRWFAFYDANGDGKLDAAEGRRAMLGNPVRHQLDPSFTESPRLAAKDLGRKWPMSPADLAAYADQQNSRYFQYIRIANPDWSIDTLTEALFKALDRDKDGRLSKAEVMAAPDLLTAWDLNEDECLSPGEVDPSMAFGGQPKSGPMPSFQPPEVVEVPSSGAPRGELGKRLLQVYDKNKDGKLSRAEIGLEAVAFDRLDRNRDGQLDADELKAWLTGTPDLEVVARLGAGAPSGGTFALTTPKTVLRQTLPDRLLLRLGSQQFDLAAPRLANGTVRARPEQLPFMEVFDRPEVKQRGYLESADLYNKPVRGLRPIMRLADRDGDGRLTAKELEEYLLLQRHAAEHAVSLTVAAQPRGWFELLDTDRDGRLSLRELQQAWDRLADDEAKRTGYITREKIARPYQLTLAVGRPLNLVNPNDARRFGNANTVNLPPYQPLQLRPVGVSEKGPLWFRKMDRNGDGFVSRREFLGTAEEFDRLDTNKDGLISPEEAEAAGPKGPSVPGKR